MTKDICENFNRLNLGDDGENSFEGGVSAKKKVFWRDFLTLIVFWKTNPQWLNLSHYYIFLHELRLFADVLQFEIIPNLRGQD